MKKIVVSLCFIISMVMCGELVAQNNDVKEIKPTESLMSPQDSVAEKKIKNGPIQLKDSLECGL